ncbi:MAG: SDR family oxidoreductase [Betaproteobacteria bacterium]|nr:SDR family oxidoreductase [Betaproteobacteria bacterium]
MGSDNTVLVTGANGFVGRALCAVLAASDRGFRRTVRAPHPDFPGAVAVGEVGPDTDWRAALDGVHCVVHLVSRTHVLRETAADPLAEYRRINVEGTLRLARQAGAAGVRRLVFVSSVKVNGEATAIPYTEDDAPRPEDAYGLTKWEAEQALARVAAETGLEVVVLRPPLVYGPGVKGNFLRLMEFVGRGVPLPLASVANLRSLVYVGNLVDAIARAIDAPQAAGRTYLVSDGEDVSTPGLVRALAQALGVKARLFPCPPAALKFAAALTGKSAEIMRLTGSLQVSTARIRDELGWRPPFTLAHGLERTAQWRLGKADTHA